MKNTLPAMACLFAALALPAVAQTRFPAIPESQIEDRLSNAYCANSISTIARTAAEIDGWRGFAMRLCDPDNRPAGVFVAWYEQRGQRRIVATLPDGRPLPTDNRQHNDSHQQSTVSIFAMRFNNRPAGCWFARSTHMVEPWSSSFCGWLDERGNLLPRR